MRWPDPLAWLLRLLSLRGAGRELETGGKEAREHAERMLAEIQARGPAARRLGADLSAILAGNNLSAAVRRAYRSRAL